MATNKTNSPEKTETHNIEIKTKKGDKHPRITVLVDSSEDAVRDRVEGFLGFLRERAIVTLAVGFVVATQVQNVIKQLLGSFLDPLTKLLFGAKLTTRTFTWHFHGRHEDFAWGQFVYVIIDFFVVVLTIYLIVKLFKLDKLEASKTDTKK
jgi:large-conductance mechanosensitive channel